MLYMQGLFLHTRYQITNVKHQNAINHIKSNIYIIIMR